MGILPHKVSRLPVGKLFSEMQGCYPCHFVLYSYGFTAEQSEATEARSLPAEIPRSCGIHGESLLPCSLGPSMTGPDVAYCLGRGFVRWLNMNCLPGMIASPSYMARGKDGVSGPAESHLPTIQRHPPCRRPLLKATLSGEKTRPLPWGLHCGERGLKSCFFPEHAWRSWPFPTSLHLYPRNNHCI